VTSARASSRVGVRVVLWCRVVQYAVSNAGRDFNQTYESFWSQFAVYVAERDFTADYKLGYVQLFGGLASRRWVTVSRSTPRLGCHQSDDAEDEPLSETGDPLLQPACRYTMT
jgi:hypothetical protein